MSSLGDRLASEYSSRLDSALVLAICSEYTDNDEEAVRSTLDALAAESSNGVDTFPAAATNADDAHSSSGSAFNSSATGATDEELVERVFRDWTLSTSEAIQDSTGAADGSAPTSSSLYDPQDGFKALSLSAESNNASTNDPVTFLKNLFPRRQTVELELAFQDSGEDVEATIETLLTEDLLIREEEEAYARWLAGDQEGLDVNARRNGRQRRKNGKQTVSLTSTPRGISSNHASRDSSPDRSAKEHVNVWAQTDSTILYLATLLSIPPGQLSSLFYQNNNSLPLALSKIMDKAEHTYSDIPDAKERVEQLRNLFPDKPISTLKRCMCAVEGDIAKSVELVQILQEIYAKEGTPLAHDLLLGLQSNGAKPVKSALIIPKVPLGSIVNGKVGVALQPGMPFERPPSATECISLAYTLKNKRDDAYRSAARTWRAKQALGNSGVAAYWAEHGRHLDRQAREWELKAARATVDERRKTARNLQAIDLHGLTVAQALTVTQECLVAWWNTPSAPSTLTIITGAGKHSSGQNPVILPAVRKLLEREAYDWKYEGDRFHRGSFLVTGLQGRRKGTGY